MDPPAFGAPARLRSAELGANTDLRYLRNGRLAVRLVLGRLAEGQMDVGTVKVDPRQNKIDV
jgi:hypothetical protein